MSVPALTDDLLALAGRCVLQAEAGKQRFALIESCTGGLVSLAITTVPGASSVYDGSLIPYSNGSKTRLAGSEDVFVAHGSVSEQAARLMASAYLGTTDVTHVVVSTGIAGPGGGSPEKPVGLVVFAIASRNGEVRSFRHLFAAELGRGGIMMEAARVMLTSLLDAIEASGLQSSV